MSVHFDSYRIFYEVVRHGNITAAAKALYVTQPTITHCIRKLESELNCTLFARSQKGVTLTPEGAILYEHVRAACETLWEGEKKLAALQNLSAGEVRVGASETTLRHFLIPYLKTFRSLYPNIRLKLANSNTPAMIQNLRNGSIDLAILVTSAPQEAEGLASYPLASFQDILIGGAPYFYLKHKTHHLKDLLSLPFIAMEPGTATRSFFDLFCEEHGLTLYPNIELATSDLIVPFVENGLGVGFAPYHFAKTALKQGSVFEISLAETIPQRQISLLKKDKEILSAAAETFFTMFFET